MDIQHKGKEQFHPFFRNQPFHPQLSNDILYTLMVMENQPNNYYTTYINLYFLFLTVPYYYFRKRINNLLFPGINLNQLCDLTDFFYFCRLSYFGCTNKITFTAFIVQFVYSKIIGFFFGKKFTGIIM